MVAANPVWDMSVTWMPREKVWEGCSEPVKDQGRTMNFKYPALQGRWPPSAPTMLLEAMETGEPYPIKAMFMMQNNAIACMGAQPQRILPALQKMEFNVVVDLFLTPTALACADVLLPAACFAERIGITGHQPYALGAIAQAVEPLGECKSDQRIIYETGSRFTDEAHKKWDDEQGFYDYLLRKTGYTYETLRERTWALPRVRVQQAREGACCAATARWASPRRPAATTSTAREMLHFGLSPLADLRGAAREPGVRRPSSPRSTRSCSPPARVLGASSIPSTARAPPCAACIPTQPCSSTPRRRPHYGIADGDWVHHREQLRLVPARRRSSPPASARTPSRPTTPGGSPSAGPRTARCSA